MISLFQGATADDVWQQVAQAFRQSDGVGTQTVEVGRLGKSFMLPSRLKTRGSVGQCRDGQP